MDSRTLNFGFGLIALNLILAAGLSFFAPASMDAIQFYWAGSFCSSVLMSFILLRERYLYAEFKSGSFALIEYTGWFLVLGWLMYSLFSYPGFQVSLIVYIWMLANYIFALPLMVVRTALLLVRKKELVS